MSRLKAPCLQNIISHHAPTPLCRYVGQLVESGNFALAARTCASAFAQHTDIWSKWIFLIISLGAVKAVTAHMPLPTASAKLPKAAYTAILSALVVADVPACVELLDAWASAFFDASVVKDAVTKALAGPPPAIHPRLGTSASTLHSPSAALCAAMLILPLPFSSNCSALKFFRFSRQRGALQSSATASQNLLPLTSRVRCNLSPLFLKLSPRRCPPPFHILPQKP